jgi:hypothetical protein
MGLFKPDMIEEVIAQRAFSLVGPSGIPSEIKVLLGKPERLPGADDYYCAFQIVGIDSDKIRCAYGIDGFQAIQLAMTAIGACLSTLNEPGGQRLSWVGDEEGGGFGFPLPE